MKKTRLFARLGAIMLAVVMCFGAVTASAATTFPACGYGYELQKWH
ncbi:MAG: hypothetical protein ACOYJ5_08350 [Acutalibacteraceae bacterium]